MSKRLGLILVLLLQFQCATALSQTAVTPPTEQRKTSAPYTKDPSIFDSPGKRRKV
jgi:hypothetical protein